MDKRILCAVVAGVCMGMAQAAEVELKIASWLPPTHSVNSVFLPKLIEEIEKRTEGRVSAKVEYDLAAPNGLLELVEYGGADISWTYNGYFPGRFVTTKLIELPGYEGSSSAAAVAHWRAHEKYLKDAEEYDGVELIGFMVHGPAFLFMNKEIGGLKDVEGRKMRAGGGVANEVAAALKTSPILAPASKSYEMIMGGMADGTMLPADVIPSFRLYEAAPHAYTLPGGFYRGSFALFMNENALDKVSEADQKAIREYFGEPLSKDAGAVWDIDYDKGLALQKEKGTITELSAEDVAKMAEHSAAIRDKVIEEANAKGVDGKAAYDLIVETFAELKGQ